jgi:hypothetical protein
MTELEAELNTARQAIAEIPQPVADDDQPRWRAAQDRLLRAKQAVEDAEDRRRRTARR